MIKKKSLADAVAQRIREEIEKGQYAVDDRLPTEPELMKTFGVGRSSVREAIRILVNSGFLRVQQGVGTFVESVRGSEPLSNWLGRADINDLMEVRELLEPRIASKAAENRTQDDLKTMKAKLTERGAYADAGDIRPCIRADVEFHLSIASACGNEILTELYHSVSEHVMSWFMLTYTDTAIFRTTQVLHEQLFEHIKAGASQKAMVAAGNIIGRV